MNYELQTRCGIYHVNSSVLNLEVFSNQGTACYTQFSKLVLYWYILQVSHLTDKWNKL
jgi:hypothetical protein